MTAHPAPRWTVGGAAPPRVVVVGGSGFYGRYLVRDLLDRTNARILVVSRRATHTVRRTDRVTPVDCDLSDRRRLVDVLRGSAAVVHCAGPFQRLPVGPFRAALEAGTHYGGSP